MNKRMANKQSTAGNISIGELRRLIEAARQVGGMSRVNRALTMEQACDIYAGAIAGRDEAERPAGWSYSSYKQRNMPSRDSLIIRNILRDCA